MESDVLPSFARADLERLKLAAEVILRFADDDLITDPLEAELIILRDRLDDLFQGVLGGLRGEVPCPFCVVMGLFRAASRRTGLAPFGAPGSPVTMPLA
jgi:hypothetical protein